MPPSNNINSSRRPTKRKAAAAPASDSSDRKRAQNRISQQCLREKNMAYVRNLEDALQLLQKAASDANGGGQNDRYGMLLDAHLKLMEENRKLEEALLRVRKKLFSLSNAAATAADDEIFDSILRRGHDNEDQNGRKDLEDYTETTLSWIEPHHHESDNNQSNSIQPSNTILTTHIFEPDDPGAFDQTILQSDPFEDGVVLLDLHAGACRMDTHKDLRPALVSGQGTLTLDSVPGLSMMMHSPRPTIFNHDRIAVTSVTVLGVKLMSACRQCIGRASSPSFLNQETLKEFGRKLVLAAARFVSCCMGLESYVYGVNGGRYIEKLLSWRLGLDVRDSVPSPFRPTPLQSKHPADHIGIDLFNWPEIRDQLLLEQQSIDFDMMMKDLILHSVIEQPHRGVAVNVLDVFQNQILRRDNLRRSQDAHWRNYLNDPSWILFEVSPEAQSFYASAADPVEEALIAELERRMRTEASMSPSDDGLSPPTAAEGYRGNEVAAFLGLDNLDEWKLSKDFARKYPFLDCSTAVSTCDLAPSATVFCW